MAAHSSTEYKRGLLALSEELGTVKRQAFSIMPSYGFSVPGEELCNRWNSRICASASAILPCLR